MAIEIISHRGARFEVPENTVEGFQHALALGMTTVEYDIHLTADDQLVVIHDDTVDRTTNGSGKVNEMTLAELQALDARSVHVMYPQPVRIPTFDAVLDVLRDMPTMEVEIKRDTPENLEKVVPMVIEKLRNSGHTGAIITSFEPYALELAYTNAPEIPRAHMGDWSNEETWDVAKKYEVSRIGINMSYASPQIVQRAKALGYFTVAWPCNDEMAVRKVIECEFDGVCTDAPSLFAPMFGRAVNKVG